MNGATRIGGNSERVRALALRILGSVAPEEVEFSQAYLEPLIGMAQAGELVTIDRNEHAGGFGGADLLLISIVPLALELFERVGQGPVRNSLKVSTEWVRRIAESTGSPAAHSKAGAIAEACNQWLATQTT